MLILGGPNVVFFGVSAMILEIHVFHRYVLNELLSRFWWKSYALVGPKKSEEWKSLGESDKSHVFSVVYISKKTKMSYNPELLFCVTVQFTKSFNSKTEVDMWKSRFFKNRSGAYMNKLRGFQGRSKSEKGCPRRLERSPVECLSDADN